MNEIITRLNEIEKKAESILKDAMERKNQMEEQLKQEKKEMDVRFDEIEKKWSMEFEAKQRQEALEQMDGQKRQMEEAVKALRENFERNQESMADEIFRRMIE